jgi:hypothetical protein
MLTPGADLNSSAVLLVTTLCGVMCSLVKVVAESGREIPSSAATEVEAGVVAMTGGPCGAGVSASGTDCGAFFLAAGFGAFCLTEMAGSSLPAADDWAETGKGEEMAPTTATDASRCARAGILTCGQDT